MSFSARSLQFFRGLTRHNAKPWFEAHRAEYEETVVAPMRALIEELDFRFARFAPEITGDPKRSMFRIYRDVRFSKDKSPYKVHAACWFWHRDADPRVGEGGEGGAGYYFHLEPGASFVGGGTWMPPRPILNQLREAIADDHQGFTKVVTNRGFVRRFGKFEDEAALKRMPRGWDEAHPAARWLRYQSFVSGREMSDREVTSARLPAILETDYKKLLPLVRWLNGALGHQPAARR